MTCDNSPTDGEKKIDDEPNSVIKLVFDQFAITHAIKKIIDKTSWKATDQLNDAVVLFIFLVVLFYESQLLKPELSLAVVTLIILLFFIVVEFVGTNIPYFSRLFFSEEKAEHFITNLESYKMPVVERNISLLTFSPKNINSLLSIIQTNKNKIHPYIVDQILQYNALSTENLDRVFSIEILKSNLRRDLIIDLLMKYKNQLSTENIENVFTVFMDDEQLIRILIATQIDSESLISIHPTNQQHIEYFDKYQKNNENKTKISTLIKRTRLNIVFFRIIAFFFFLPFFWISILFCLSYFNMVNSLNIGSTMLVSLFISGFLVSYVIKPIVDRVVYYWIDASKTKFLATL